MVADKMSKTKRKLSDQEEKKSGLQWWKFSFLHATVSKSEDACSVKCTLINYVDLAIL